MKIKNLVPIVALTLTWVGCDQATDNLDTDRSTNGTRIPSESTTPTPPSTNPPASPSTPPPETPQP